MKIYILVGVPCAGKSWVCEQLQDKFTYVHHDLYIGMAGDVYVAAILEALKTTTKPILAEAPFSVSGIIDPLKRAGCDVECVFILEADEVLRARYQKREHKPIPINHLSRQRTYRGRARGSFSGTSAEMLAYLRSLP